MALCLGKIAHSDSIHYFIPCLLFSHLSYFFFSHPLFFCCFNELPIFLKWWCGSWNLDLETKCLITSVFHLWRKGKNQLFLLDNADWKWMEVVAFWNKGSVEAKISVSLAPLRYDMWFGLISSLQTFAIKSIQRVHCANTNPSKKLTIAAPLYRSRPASCTISKRAANLANFKHAFASESRLLHPDMMLYYINLNVPWYLVNVVSCSGFLCIIQQLTRKLQELFTCTIYSRT